MKRTLREGQILVVGGHGGCTKVLQVCQSVDWYVLTYGFRDALRDQYPNLYLPMFQATRVSEDNRINLQLTLNERFADWVVENGFAEQLEEHPAVVSVDLSTGVDETGVPVFKVDAI